MTKRLNLIGDEWDRDAAFSWAGSVCGDQAEVNAYVRLQAHRARLTMAMPMNRAAITALAEELVMHKRLTGRQARQIIRQAILA